MIGVGGCCLFLLVAAYALKLDEARELFQIIKGNTRE
jgi:hypothetical protein